MNLLYDEHAARLDTDEFGNKIEENKDAAHGTEIKNNLKELIANLGMSAEDNKIFGIRESKEEQQQQSAPSPPLSKGGKEKSGPGLTIDIPSQTNPLSGDAEGERRKEETSGFLNKKECKVFQDALIQLRKQKRSQGHHENENEPMGI